MKVIVNLIFLLIFSCLLNAKEHREFYKNGNLQLNVEMTEDIYNGEYLVFYENGNIMITGQFENNLPVGEFLTYYKNGTIYKKEIYKNGYLLENIKYFKNSKIQSYIKNDKSIQYNTKYYNNKLNSKYYEGIWDKGKEVKRINYYPNAKIEYIVKYENDIAIEGYYFDKNNQKIKLTKAHLYNAPWNDKWLNYKLNISEIPDFNDEEKTLYQLSHIKIFDLSKKHY